MFGIRDRDFLLDTEIERITNKYPYYFILEYYCFENYLYHPDNIQELELASFDKDLYKDEIIKQKNEKKNHIISIYRNSRNTYQEFKIEHENLRDKNNEDKIIEYLMSDDIEIFFKAFSMKDYYNKTIIGKYGLKDTELITTKWFKDRIEKIIKL